MPPAAAGATLNTQQTDAAGLEVGRAGESLTIGTLEALPPRSAAPVLALPPDQLRDLVGALGPGKVCWAAGRRRWPAGSSAGARV